MKKINNLSKEKAQRILFITVLILVFGVFFISLSFIEPNEDPIDDPTEDPIDDDEDEEPEFETIRAPYTDQKQTIRKFWSLEQTTEDQEISIIVFGSTYYLSRGVSFANDNQDFSVVASLSGKVKEVSEDQLYGNTVIIEHDNNIITEYISLGTVDVEVGDDVEQGDVIGTSGTNEYDQLALNHVHFKISVDGKYYDPEKLIGKPVNEIDE